MEAGLQSDQQPAFFAPDKAADFFIQLNDAMLATFWMVVVDLMLRNIHPP